MTTTLSPTGEPGEHLDRAVDRAADGHLVAAAYWSSLLDVHDVLLAVFTSTASAGSTMLWPAGALIVARANIPARTCPVRSSVERDVDRGGARGCRSAPSRPSRRGPAAGCSSVDKLDVDLCAFVHLREVALEHLGDDPQRGRITDLDQRLAAGFGDRADGGPARNHDAIERRP